MSTLALEHISFGFRDQPPMLSDISFTLNTADLAVLAGQNGSGKTSLLRVMAGLLRPTQGQVLLDRVSIEDTRGDVAIVLQNPDHQMIAETVEREVAMALEFRAVPTVEMRQRVDQILHEFELYDLRYRSPQRLSGGQKQRVALAAIMIAKPKFLLLDEPDSYLDGPSRKRFRQSIELLRGKTGVLWTVPHFRSVPRANKFLFLSDSTVSQVTEQELAVATSIAD